MKSIIAFYDEGGKSFQLIQRIFDYSMVTGPASGISSSSVPGEKKIGTEGTLITVGKTLRLFFRTDYRVREVQGKADSLITAFQSLSLIIKKQNSSLN